MVRPNGTPDELLADDAVALAARLVEDGHKQEPRRQRRRAVRLSRLVESRESMRTVVALTDEVIRIGDRRRAALRFRDLANSGLPTGFSKFERLLLKGGAAVAPHLPRVVLPLVVARIRKEAAGVVLPSEDPAFRRHLERRKAVGLRANINLLGEAVLGEDEARRRLDELVERVARPDVEYVSVKASAICAQLSSLAFSHSVSRVSERLRQLYSAANASTPPVFINLDMEEHRDLELTIAAFSAVLTEQEYANIDAGIVLQAYLPDAHHALEELATFAVERRKRGGGQIKVRIVKGANLLMERVEAELRGWPQAPYLTKAETDASWKRLVERALDPVFGTPPADGLRVGAGSHNLFDIAFALTVAQRLGATERLDIEMLEGMADGQALAVKSEIGAHHNAGSAILYTPVVKATEFESAVAYLVRRLDESTAPGHFLPKLLHMRPDSAAFKEEERLFRLAVTARRTVATTSRRTQDRTAGPVVVPTPGFVNEPDTDFSRPCNRRWIQAEIDEFVMPLAPPMTDTIADIDRLVAEAREAGIGWARLATDERRAILTVIANTLAKARGESIAMMVEETHKTIGEADSEVSEAVDFARFYARSTTLFDVATAASCPLGVIVVAPPWNFPYAIPAGGVLAGLAAGNAVILKPAPESIQTAALLARQLHGAGLPPHLVTYVRCPEDEVGRALITHPDVGGIILTGAAETAELFMTWRPDLRLSAETSGKNAIVVTAAADLDLAVKDLVQSAFSHAGQKCSAASLAIVERSVLDEGRFLAKLSDAVRTLATGSPRDPATDIAPLVHEPSAWLAEVLTALEPGESWLVRPEQVGDDPRHWSPGVKLGVSPGSRSHFKEWFGPVLGIIAANDLAHAIALQNATSFGLTGGIHSLDDGEVERWIDEVEVGNAYINRPITGAIVSRQPFGGWKRSSVGPGCKAGGPGYVTSLCLWADPDCLCDDPVARLTAARESYCSTWAILAVPHDESSLVSEANVLRYLPLPGVVLRVEADAYPGDEELCRLAATTTGTPVDLSTPARETVDELAQRLDQSPATRVRWLSARPVPEVVYRAGVAAWVHVTADRPVAEGRVELLRWVREQSISRTTHRYGTLRTGA